MVGAVAAPPLRRRIPSALFPSLRLGLRRLWSFSWADPDPASTPPSSSSSSSSSSSRRQQGKLPHRLSSVVDAINERKLPPELRGRGNAIRSSRFRFIILTCSM
ncbi:hypothetical protein BHE74_00036663 [Ensete ventricosum]|nr:hypothetical protein BHE74_00036663 [Ensete ventricosum]